MVGLAARRMARARVISRRSVMLARSDNDSFMVGRRGAGLDPGPSEMDLQPGRLAKWNLTCPCWMCRYQGENPRRQDWRWDRLVVEEDLPTPDPVPVYRRLPGRYRRGR